MLRELRKLAKINRPKAQYIRTLQYEGKIQKIVNGKGYICYESEELKAYQSSAHRGRPPKIVNVGGEQ